MNQAFVIEVIETTVSHQIKAGLKFEPSLCNRSYRNNYFQPTNTKKQSLNQAFVIEVIETLFLVRKLVRLCLNQAFVIEVIETTTILR